MDEIVLIAKNNIWSVLWKDQNLQVTPVGINYRITHGDKVLHEDINMLGMIQFIRDFTGRIPRFTTERNESSICS